MNLNLSGLLEEVDNDYNSLPYILKMYLRDKVGIPMIIDPNNPGDPSFEVEAGEFNYEFLVDDPTFSISIDYTPYILEGYNGREIN
ncbi:hypothetical protein NCTGTJJY_CDS0061 [Serratia phage 92A1]|nr:hypothetical protein NCTGTJJY_CDS0061 [Serratia phage 92A1]